MTQQQVAIKRTEMSAKQTGKKASPNVKPRNRAGGKAGGGGYSYQAQVAAYVATHIIAGRQMGWVGNLRNDFPIALNSETGEIGDDIGIELVDSSFRLDAQVKKGLTGGIKLKEALHPFAAIPDDGSVEGVLVVDFNSSRTIWHDLRADLRRVRGGRSDDLSSTTKDVITFFEGKSASHAPRFLTIVPISIEERSDSHRRAAIEMLVNLFVDEIAAETIFELLENYCLKQIKDRGRLTKADVLFYLQARNYAVPERAVNTLIAQKSAANLGPKLEPIAPTLILAGDAVDIPKNADVWNIEIDKAKQLIQIHRPQEALENLLSLESRMKEKSIDNAAGILPQTWLRLHGNLGVALFQLGRVSDARARIEAAIEHAPNDARTHANLARMLLIEGDTQRAMAEARLAISYDRNATYAWSVLAELNAPECEDPPAVVAESVDWIVGRASLLLERKSFAPAIELIRRALAIDPTVERKFQLANAIFVSGDTSNARHQVSDGQSEALQLLDDVIEDLGVGSFSGLLEQCLLLRAMINRIAGKWEQAEADASLALRLHPSNAPDLWRAVAVLISIQLETQRPREALAVLQTIPNSERFAPLMILRARVHAILADTEAVRKTLIQTLDLLPSSNSKGELSLPEAVFNCIDIALDVRLIDLADFMLTRFDNTELGWLGKLARARIAVTSEKLGVAIEYYQGAIAEMDKTASVDLVRLELAMILGRLGRYEESVRKYEEASAWQKGDSFRANYIQSLMQAGRFEYAFSLLESLQGAAELPEWANVPMAVLFEMRGDLKSAIVFLEPLLNRSPTSASVLLRLNSLFLRESQPEKAAFVLRLLLQRKDFSPRERLIFSGQLFESGDRNIALRNAFRALRDASGQDDYTEIRDAYVRLFVQAEMMGVVPQPRAVGPDMRIRLASVARGARGNGFVIDIFSELPKSPQANEFVISQEEVGTIIGKRVRDIVSVEGMIGRRGRFRIESIELLPALAFATALKEVTAEDSSDVKLRSIPVGETGSVRHLMPILSEMFHQQYNENELLDLHLKQGFPLGAIAKLSGRPLVEVYWLAIERGPHLLVEHSDYEHQRAVETAARSDSPLVITRSALATLSYLHHNGFSLLEPITKLDRKLLSCRSLLDELHEERRGLLLNTVEGSTRMGASATGFSVVRQTPKEVQENLDRFDELLHWFNLNVEIVPLPFSSFSPTAMEQCGIIGNSSSHAIDVCHERHATLFADDRGLCDLASERGVLLCTSTRGILVELSSRDLISAQEARASIARLIHIRHHFVPLSADFLVALARDEGYQITERVRLVFQRLADPMIPLDMKVEIATLCLFDVAATGGMGGILLKQMTQRFLIDFTEHNLLEIVTGKLRMRIREKLVFLPNHLAEIERTIADFSRARRVGSSLK